MKKEDFTTTDLALTAFLSVKGFQLLSIKNGAKKRKTFVFNDSPQLINMVGAFNFGEIDSKEVMVDARTLLTTLKEIKGKLHTVL